MPRKRYSAEEIIQHLRTVELEQGRGATLEEAAKKNRRDLANRDSLEKRIRRFESRSS